MSKYSQEFKLRVIQHFLSSHDGHKRTAKLFNIHHSQVQRWVALFERGGGLWPYPFDVYILIFREGQEIPPHVDKVDRGEHYRLNIVLKASESGGEFICRSPIFENRRIKYFRSDISEHAVSRVLKGSRYVLSIGWVKDT